MKKIFAVLCALSLAATLSARDDEHDPHQGGGHPDGGAPAQPQQQAPQPRPAKVPHAQRAPKPHPAQAQAPAPAARPNRIDLGRPSSYRPYHPAAQAQRPQPGAQVQPQGRPQAQAPYVPQAQRRIGNVVRHPSYVKAAAPERLKQLGVTFMPKPIANRAHLLATDRAHSIVAFKHNGPDGRPMTQRFIGAREWSNPAVLSHMNLVADPARRDAFVQLNLTETQNNHYYWHHDSDGSDYCHYRDSWGYHWYGWTAGDRFFWTRNYANRWWFYDDAANRWCFWNNGFWWWQDPAHVGNLYAYSDGEYLAGTSSDDDVEVSTVEPANPVTYRSPDNTRMVKLMNDSKDAFLYDTAIPPAFNPLYLASTVSNVQFSDTSSGQPLQVTLTLGDGSMETFDSQGSAVDFDGDQEDSDPNQGNGH
jgi:hypothetical protein